MSIFNKFLKGVKLVDDDYDDYDEYEDDDYEEEERRGFFGFGKKKVKEEEDNQVEAAAPERAKLTPMRGGKGRSSVRVCVIKPTSFDDVKEIADTLLSNSTVILNMEGIDLALAQRIIDFMMGSCYSIDGNLQKISNYIFIITPAAVGISGDLQGLVDAFEETKMASGGGFASF